MNSSDIMQLDVDLILVARTYDSCLLSIAREHVASLTNSNSGSIYMLSRMCKYLCVCVGGLFGDLFSTPAESSILNAIAPLYSTGCQLCNDYATNGGNESSIEFYNQ
uniref:Uncharacterized protein n=1 Tax=Glossina pallidipes TaxID=7398 RepID=A0A1A9Z5D3_GLOPL